MTRMMPLAIVALLTAACSGNSTAPTSPPPVTHTFGAQVSSTCGRFPNTVTSVAIIIDGQAAGTATPGGPAVTTQVTTLGNHAVAGRAQNGLTWTDNRTLTASQPDFIVTFACV